MYKHLLFGKDRSGDSIVSLAPRISENIAVNIILKLGKHLLSEEMLKIVNIMDEIQRMISILPASGVEMEQCIEQAVEKKATPQTSKDECEGFLLEWLRNVFASKGNAPVLEFKDLYDHLRNASELILVALAAKPEYLRILELIKSSFNSEEQLEKVKRYLFDESDHSPGLKELKLV